MTRSVKKTNHSSKDALFIVAFIEPGLFNEQ